MRVIFFLMSVLISFHAYGQEDAELTHKKANYPINDYYKAGNFLIYNCENDYYVCVDEDAFKLCGDKRKEAIDKKLKYYPCAPLNKFPTKAKCGEKNYEVIESLAKKRFCYPK
ncbi:MAG: hypothetical protein H7177_14120 [Rhizobacter sp.]|nr:hypothetical protein [Bacteriovorax sp.]